MYNSRLLLTNDSIEVQQIIMNIVKQIVNAAQEDFKTRKTNLIGGNGPFHIFLTLCSFTYFVGLIN